MNPNPDIDMMSNGWWGVGILYVLLTVGVATAGFVFAMLTMLATRRTAKATELLAREVAEIKAYLTSKGE